MGALANGQHVVKSFRYLLTDHRQFDILQSGPWLAGVGCNSIQYGVHLGGGERIMRSDVRALLRPLVKTVGLLLAVALGVVACLLVLLLMVRGSDAADREMTQEYATCLGKSNGVTIEMINCILGETRRQDARLNENYKRLISKLPTERKNALVEAQRAWIKFRDANCGFYADPEGGSAARVTANECFLNATADRAKELRLLADDLP
jgi:uncharacterized protein YecT (DUF1311 family)